ncbi:MAG TPA: DUF294 nucleotidyltransferase-like domain-containing protein [Candidatus Omnitrophota bacterium]|nr:DUF294 nucleotidyltransferase-like domain-containing protein [Candidatus Omnitrophota bacterium]
MIGEINRPPAEFRNGVRNAFFSDHPIAARKLEHNYGQLMSGSGDAVRSASDSLSAVLALRDFHFRNLLRISDLYKKSSDPVLVASQLADLRKTLAVQAFRLAASENPGNYALAIGGSATKGDHTVLTDIDSVVIAAKDEDREAALRVQELMVKILDSTYVESDDVMPFHFACLPVDKLAAKFPLVKKSELTDPFQRSMWLSNGSFFRFLMDLQVVDSRGKEKTSFYAHRLDEMREKVNYQNHEAMLELCGESFAERTEEKESRGPSHPRPFDIKNEALRPFYYALYAARARYGIKTPSPWKAVAELTGLGILSEKEKEAIELAIRFLLDLRHLIGFSIIHAKDSKTLSDEAVRAIAYSRGISDEEVVEKAQAAAATLRAAATKILTQLRAESSK